MNRNLMYLFFIVALIFPVESLYSSVLTLSSPDTVYPANNNLYQLKNHNEKIPLNNSLWTDISGQNYFGYLSEGCWFKVPFLIHNSDTEFFFQIDCYFTEYIDFYLVKNGTVIRKRRAGLFFESDINPLNSINHTFSLGFLEKGRYDLLFYVKSDEAFLPLRFLSSSQLINLTNRYLMLNGIIYGILFAFLFVNIYFMISDKSTFRSVLYFMLFLFSILLYLSSRAGYLNTFLWPHNTWMIKRFYLIILSIANIWSYMLLYEFLDLKRTSRIFTNLININIVLSLLFILVFSLAPDDWRPRLISGGRILQLYFILFGMSLSVFSLFQQRSLPDKIFSSGWILGLLFFLLATLKAKGILPYQNFQIYALSGVLLTSVFQIIAFGFRAVQKENERKRLASRLQQAGYQLMQSRGRPHFLMNVFSMLHSEITENPEKVETLINLLITDFSFYTRKALKPLISLKEEILFIENYIEILKIRYNEKLTVVFSGFDTTASENIFIPPFSLQPLVENAVKYCREDHGSKNISLSFSSNHNEVCVDITNPVAEISDFRLGETHKNISDRLSYFYNNVKIDIRGYEEQYVLNLAFTLSEGGV